jgi:transcription initiation factor TFIID subunit 12
MANSSPPSATPAASQVPVPPGGSNNIITALSHVFKAQTGDSMSSERIAQMLFANMPQLGELAKQGKLNHQQIMQVRFSYSLGIRGIESDKPIA